MLAARHDDDICRINISLFVKRYVYITLRIHNIHTLYMYNRYFYVILINIFYT